MDISVIVSHFEKVEIALGFGMFILIAIMIATVGIYFEWHSLNKEIIRRIQNANRSNNRHNSCDSSNNSFDIRKTEK